MGKKAKKNEVRGPVAVASAKNKQKFNKKKNTRVELNAVSDTVKKAGEGESLLDQLSDQNKKEQTKSLMALSAVSFDETMPIDMFYDAAMLTRVLELANQLSNNANMLAMDAIRNLFI